MRDRGMCSALQNIKKVKFEGLYLKVKNMCFAPSFRYCLLCFLDIVMLLEIAKDIFKEYMRYGLA